ncbi:MAG TPA: mandelate racemase/muconate lactonizing enzyme family protein [archaeon]|nr:mandelate racemase/muconate lactonizing enzyme family protein [archaeon]
MKITDISTSHIRIPLPQPFHPAWRPGQSTNILAATILEIQTDEGISGISALQHNTGVVPPPEARIDVLISKFLKPILIGADPTENEKLILKLRAIKKMIPLPWFVSVALWDIVGKKAKMPLYKFWGGAQRRLKAYASVGEIRPNDVRAKDVENFANEGFKAVKIRLHGSTVEEDIEQVRTVRERVGDRIELMVDANQAHVMTAGPKWDLHRALKTARELEKFNIVWLEEPLLGFDFDDLSLLCKASPVRIAGGEDNQGVNEFRWMLEKGAYDVLQPDCNVSEGIFDLRKIAGMAEAYNRWFVPHTWGNGLGLVANLQLAASCPNCPYLEYPYDPPNFTIEAYYAMLKEPIRVEADGYVSVPEGPGLGVELNRDAIEKYNVGTT